METPHLYGVLGLYDPMEEVAPPQPPPILLKATLLPFNGQIIYDGLVQSYSVLFGSGIRGDLNANYNRLKQKEGIIEQLVGATGQKQTRTSLKSATAKPAPDWKPAIDGIVTQVGKMKRTDTAEQGAALGLLRAAAHLAQASLAESDEVQANLKQVRRAVTRLENVLFEEEYG